MDSFVTDVLEVTSVSDTAIESIFKILSTLFLDLSQVVGIPFVLSLLAHFLRPF